MGIDITPDWRDRVRRLLPDLREGLNFQFTSEVDYNYNCLSWALSCNTRPFENSKGAFWPWENIPDDTAEGWAGVCQMHGFAVTDSIEFSPGLEKIAIFEAEDGSLHASRQDQTGRWKSKLGDMGPDIDHDSLAALEAAYGKVVRVLQRRRRDWEESAV